MLGIQPALMDVLLPGTRFQPSAAQAKGLVDEIVAADELIPAAKAWIVANKDDAEAAKNPWDRDGFRIPGGDPRSPKFAQFLPMFPSLLRQQTKGADYHAPRAILSSAIEGAQVDFDTASRIESRYLTKLAGGQQARNMIQAFFFDLQAINSGSLRPAGIPPYKAVKVGVLGAGMMGAGIAYSCARAGMEVVLKDVSSENAEKGKSYSEKLLDKAISRGKSTEEKKAELLGRITATADPADLAGCDLVIEAVFEDPSLKHKVFAEILPHVNRTRCCAPTPRRFRSPGSPTVWTAQGFHRPALLLAGRQDAAGRDHPREQTSDEALAKAYDVVQQIRKTPIVVNDSRGFYTSRVIGTMVNEGLAMLGEGVHPMSLERAATQAGYPVGTLQLSDELNLELMKKIQKATKDAVEAAGATYPSHPSEKVIDTMLSLGRPSRLEGAGFYEYVDGRRAALGPGSPRPSRWLKSSRRWRTSRTGCSSPRLSRPRSASRRV